MESNRRCSNCGREIYQGASKCAYCGYPYRGDYVDGKPQSAGKADAGTVEDLCLLEQANAMTAEQMSKDLLPVQPTAR